MKKTLQYLQECLENKKNKAIKTANMIFESMDGLETSSITFSFRSLSTRVNEDGSFFVLTGTKTDPAGIGTGDYDFVFAVSKEKGALVPTEAIKDIIRNERSSLKIGIDEEYKKMGVWMNIGMITSFLDEDFSFASLQPSDLDSSTATPA